MVLATKIGSGCALFFSFTLLPAGCTPAAPAVHPVAGSSPNTAAPDAEPEGEAGRIQDEPSATSSTGQEEPSEASPLESPSSVTPAPAPRAEGEAPDAQEQAFSEIELEDSEGKPLPQTEEKPSVDSPFFQDNARRLFDAIVADDAELAKRFFFPLVAYEQVKHIADPARDWETRLFAAYKKDIHTYHRNLGKFRGEAKFKEVRVAESLAKWVKPGEEVNKVGYYRVMRSVLVYEDHAGRDRELGIITMISWRGEWYVVHLAPFK